MESNEDIEITSNMKKYQQKRNDKSQKNNQQHHNHNEGADDLQSFTAQETEQSTVNWKKLSIATSVPLTLIIICLAIVMSIIVDKYENDPLSIDRNELPDKLSQFARKIESQRMYCTCHCFFIDFLGFCKFTMARFLCLSCFVFNFSKCT